MPKSPAQRRIHFDNVHDSPQSTVEIFAHLQAAISHTQVVEMEYTSLSDEKTDRTVEPFAFYSTRDNWILIAYCRLRKTFRKFRTDRISSIKMLDEQFDAHNLTMEEFFEKY